MFTLCLTTMTQAINPHFTDEETEANSRGVNLSKTLARKWPGQDIHPDSLVQLHWLGVRDFNTVES